ncbi:MucR family transcriptional regulator [Rhizobium sp. PP-CC-2G-626]|nr:MucR family transcriptional regulator [Rhizobium sp. PP-CC-2G-626]
MLDNPPGDDPVITLTARIVAAYVTKHTITVAQLSDLIGQTRQALGSLAQTAPALAEPEKPTPAVPIRRSIHNDYLICLEDGQQYKTLKRHLMHKFGMTPDQYREKWGLPEDYPMVAPGYSARRSELAKGLGLGIKRIRQAV